MDDGGSDGKLLFNCGGEGKEEGAQQKSVAFFAAAKPNRVNGNTLHSLSLGISVAPKHSPEIW